MPLTHGVWVHQGRLPSSTTMVAHVLGQLAPRAVVGLRSAAAMHGLLEAPEVLDFIAPRGTWRTTAPWPFEVRRFDVKGKAAPDQVTHLPLEPALVLPVTSAPSTVVDLLRFRSVVSTSTAALALRRFLDAGGHLDALASLARERRARTALEEVFPLARLLPLPLAVEDCRPLAFPPGLPEHVPPISRPGPAAR
ncbi:MAG: hypothetical protein AMXMBFR34_28290 [Myxococcaceae bacterium]